jgi:carboxypeptidase C (cathepsin A)
MRYHAAMDDRSNDDKAPNTRPKGSSRTLGIELGGEKMRYEATADWLVLRKEDKPLAEMFYVHYRLVEPKHEGRPITFVFNGGPGAASAYLHVGALGPKRVTFNADGTLPKPPVRLVDNAESWLAFTDLVFIDPIGTGFSRVIEEPETKAADKPAEPKPQDKDRDFYTVNRDLESLGELITKFLSKTHSWTRPVFIAGESYGGFRVAKLARRLQQGFGVGLSGAILISPALEIGLLNGSDYDVLQWTDVFPSMALAALHHGRSRAIEAGTSLEAARARVEAFASSELASLLIRGESIPAPEYQATCARTAAFLGVSEAFVADRGGRISRDAFVRELLRADKKICGLYDAATTAIDPFPDRESFQGADPTLYAVERAFTAGINSQIREGLGLETEREYRLLNFDANAKWKLDGRGHDFELQVGATDDLRYGMALNPHMRVFITHGLYDLVTPYHASDRIGHLMRLQPSQRDNLVLKHYQGGHMFYVWEASRRAFHHDMATFFTSV